jgi:N-acetyl sugar amidotransferase
MSESAKFRVCTFCVMDSAIPTLTFDAEGRCQACRDAESRMPHEWWPNEAGEKKQAAMVEELRAAGRGRPYDAMIGLSGGIDSAYLAHHVVRNLGLRVLAVHVDGGWNSVHAVRNIELLVRNLDLDLHTFVVEWPEMRDIQLAFLRASVVNQDIPQDHAFFSTLYRTAMRYRISHFLSGVNFASECVNPPHWGHSYMDAKHIRGIQRRFGDDKLRDYPFMGLPEFMWHTRITRRLSVHRPLNYLAYDKEQAKRELERVYDWQNYGGKHCESRFTKFYQEIYLPRKYGFDKRRLHLASLVVSGQLTRQQAFEELATPITTPEQARRDVRFVAKKLHVTPTELESLIDLPPVDHVSYPNQVGFFNFLHFGKRLLTRFKRPAHG